VVALFPFGLMKPLRYLPGEDIWQTRFLVPADLPDGTYPVRLVMRDHSGQTYRESKTFVIASKSPTVQIKLPKTRYRRGEVLDLKVAASQNTRTLVARLEGSVPATLRWDAKSGANTGQLLISEKMIPGTYHLSVTAEDVAHNMGSQGVDIEIVP
jgi:Ca-activated chloride channel family protein